MGAHNQLLLKSVLLVVALTVPAIAGGPSKPLPSKEQQLLEQALRELAPSEDTRYLSAHIDLNGDGRKEAVAYLIGPETCGSGGCPTLVFSLDESRKSYRLVSSVELTRPPIFAAQSKTQGWRDLIVFVAGGGILEGYNVVLPFNGSSYPESPFLDPAFPLKGQVRGELLIERQPYDSAKSPRGRLEN